MFYPVGSDHVLQERGASDFSPVWKGIFKRGTMKRSFAVRPADKPPDNLQSFFFEPEKHPAIRVPYFRDISFCCRLLLSRHALIAAKHMTVLQ